MKKMLELYNDPFYQEKRKIGRTGEKHIPLEDIIELYKQGLTQ